MNELTLTLSSKDAHVLAEYLLIAQQAMLASADDKHARSTTLDTYLRDHASAAADLRARVLRAGKRS